MNTTATSLYTNIIFFSFLFLFCINTAHTTADQTDTRCLTAPCHVVSMTAQYGFQCSTPKAWTVYVTHIFGLLRMSSPTPALGVASFQHMDPTRDPFGKQCCSTSAYRSTIRFRTVRFRTVRNRTFQRIERHARHTVCTRISQSSWSICNFPQCTPVFVWFVLVCL